MTPPQDRELTLVEAIRHVERTPTPEMLQARAAMAQLVLERSALNDPGLWLGLLVRLREATRS